MKFVFKKEKDYGKEAKSIGDCGEDCSSCTHGVFDSTRHDLVYAMCDVRGKMSDVREGGAPKIGASPLSETITSNLCRRN